jgi:hypothetical protein
VTIFLGNDKAPVESFIFASVSPRFDGIEFRLKHGFVSTSYYYFKRKE